MSQHPHAQADRQLDKDIRIAFAAFIAAVVAVTLYVVRFGSWRVGDPEHWAAFGDYFGGVVNPAIGIVTVLLIVRTLQTTRREAEHARRQFQAHLDHVKLQHTLGEMQKRLDGALREWDRVMSHPVKRLVRVRPNCQLYEDSSFRTVGEALHSFQLSVEAAIAGDQRLSGALDSWEPVFVEAADLVRELAGYCAEYEDSAGDSIVADFYRARVEFAALTLRPMGLISPETHESLARKIGDRVRR